MGIRENLENIRKTLKSGVTLVAVSKTRSIEEITEAFTAGQVDFGENKIQELMAKMEKAPAGIKWHFIGGLQSNKVKFLDERVALVHSLDRMKLLEDIDRNAKKKNFIQNCLIEINIGREENKAGIMTEDLDELVEAAKSKENIKILGLMAVIPICDEEDQRKYFTKMKEIFDELKKTETQNFTMKILSMGMSGDYITAMECGSDMVRIGTAIFGERDYSVK